MILTIVDKINGSHKITINDAADLFRVAEDFGISKKELMLEAPLMDLDSFANYVVQKLNEHEESAVFRIDDDKPQEPAAGDGPEEEDPWVAAKYARGGEEELARLNEKYKAHDLLSRLSFQKKNKQ